MRAATIAGVVRVSIFRAVAVVRWGVLMGAAVGDVDDERDEDERDAAGEEEGKDQRMIAHI